MIRWIGVPLGLLTLLIEFFVVWVPAMSGRGDGLDLPTVFTMTAIGVGLILASVIPGLVRLNGQTNGAVVFTLRVLGTAYLFGKVALGTARATHRAITRP